MLHIYFLTHPRKFEVELVRLYAHASAEEKAQINTVYAETDLDNSFECLLFNCNYQPIFILF